MTKEDIDLFELNEASSPRASRSTSRPSSRAAYVATHEAA